MHFSDGSKGNLRDLDNGQSSVGELAPNNKATSASGALIFDPHSNIKAPLYGVDDAFKPKYWNLTDILSLADTDSHSNASAQLDRRLATPYIPDFTHFTNAETSARQDGVPITLDFFGSQHQSPSSDPFVGMNTLESLTRYKQPYLLSHKQPIFKPPRAFLLKSTANGASPVTRAFIINTIRSYKGMLLSGHDLPPFIHPQSLSSCHHNAVQTLPQPLAVCASIVQMFKAKTNKNSDFIWSTVRTAQQTLLEEASSLGDWDVVAALQAIAIYFILRISEVDQDNMNFDVPLIQTMIVGCLLLLSPKQVDTEALANVISIRNLLRRPMVLVLSMDKFLLMGYQPGRIGL